jgi:hypothetical protein
MTQRRLRRLPPALDRIEAQIPSQGDNAEVRFPALDPVHLAISCPLTADMRYVVNHVPK